jgi:hypothetical protein
LATEILIKPHTQYWRVAVCAIVGAYLALGVVTNSIRSYHWFVLVAIPFAILSGEQGRRFFLDWSPLFAFWLVYDRLRLIQQFLYSRVAVEQPFEIERWAFGWMTSGAVPAHLAHAWLANNSGALAGVVVWSAQVIYFSHLFFVPLLILVLWLLGQRRRHSRALFLRHVRAFTLLNFSAIAIYLLLPVAPPWWVTLNGIEKPTIESVAQVNMAAAMNGPLIQGMISNASQWFAAVPSLHGAYPVLLLLLLRRDVSWLVLSVLALYGCAMWSATVVLNQHYVVDLVAGAALAIAAWWVERRFSKRAA